MNLLTNRIEQIITPSLANMGYSLVQVCLTGQDGGRKTLQIMTECSDGSSISLDDCAAISRTVSTLLDVEDLIKDRYTLEVSSPGIDRPLVKPEDFVRFRGRMAKISLKHVINERKRFTGILGDFKDDILSITMDDGEVANFRIGDIEKAKLLITDELLKKKKENVVES